MPMSLLLVLKTQGNKGAQATHTEIIAYLKWKHGQWHSTPSTPVAEAVNLVGPQPKSPTKNPPVPAPAEDKENKKESNQKNKKMNGGDKSQDSSCGNIGRYIVLSLQDLAK